MRPYNHPDNLRPDGKPKMSENAWEIYEQLRQDMEEDTSWGGSLASYVEKLATKEDVIGFFAALENYVTKKDFNSHITAFGNNQEVLLAINTLSDKMESIKTAILAICEKLDNDAIPGADTDYKATALTLL